MKENNNNETVANDQLFGQDNNIQTFCGERGLYSILESASLTTWNTNDIVKKRRRWLDWNAKQVIGRGGNHLRCRINSS